MRENDMIAKRRFMYVGKQWEGDYSLCFSLILCIELMWTKFSFWSLFLWWWSLSYFHFELKIHFGLKIQMPRVRVELTTFRYLTWTARAGLWDWRATYCANEAPMSWPLPWILNDANETFTKKLQIFACLALGGTRQFTSLGRGVAIYD